MSESERKIPINELDLQLMTIENEWGKEISPELKEQLKILGEDLETETDGKFKVKKTQLWGLLSYYTRDMRLANFNKEEFYYCNEWLNFSGDCLRQGFIRSFLTSLSRVITVVELSQSKGGFVRKRLGTFTQEHYNEFKDSDKKKGLLGNNKKEKKW
jgi:hypothetical protein